MKEGLSTINADIKIATNKQEFQWPMKACVDSFITMEPLL